MHVTFCLPVTGHHPIGGHKVVYEYANGLAEKGHNVTLIHPSVSRLGTRAGERLARHTINYGRRMTGAHRPDSWFDLDPRVSYRLVPDLNARYLPDGDAVIATAWQTAEWVTRYPVSKGKKFYFIQHLETWNGPEDRVLRTWDLNLEKIVIARWLEDIATSRGQKCHYVPNGIDFSRFGTDTPPESRNPHRILMLCHHQPFKGTAVGMKALGLVRKDFPDIDVHLFGVNSRPAELPFWVHYHQNPSQKDLRRLYNESAVFVAPSLAEGWPLPPAEAMQCSATVVATDIGGHREYMQHETTALLAQPGNAEGLAALITTCLKDDETRLAIAENGHANIQRFRWPSAIDRMESILSGQPASGYSELTAARYTDPLAE